MARRSQTSDPRELQQRLLALLGELPSRLQHGSVGEQVTQLVRTQHTLRDLGASIGAALAPEDADSGAARILAYLRSQVGRVIHTDELMIVAGIGDYPRRIRELRTHRGWPIVSGLSVQDIRTDGLAAGISASSLPTAMVPEEYILIEDHADEDARQRWTEAGTLHKKKKSPKDNLKAYLSAHRGKRLTSEELRYVSGNSKNWASLCREFNDEDLRIAARFLGTPDLPVGIYIVQPK